MTDAAAAVHQPGRIPRRFKDLAEANKKALIAFITAGDPSPEFTVPSLHGLVAGGADLLELGIPFSDPEAEGPAIQASSERALSHGVTLLRVLDMVREFRKGDTQTPIILMGYLNSVLAMQDFAAQAATAGADGLIMVNLPPEEADELQQELAAHGLDLIFLIAPTTTPERAQSIIQRATGFIYYVSLKGITGAGNIQTDEVAQRTDMLRAQTDTPVCVGFGIKDGDSARRLAPHADGVVVGSALVQRMASGDHQGRMADTLEAAAKEIRSGLDSAD